MVDYVNDLSEFINFGSKILENFREVYNRVDMSIKRELLNSRLNEKPVFMGRKYRTPKFKENFAFIDISIDRLQRGKTKKGNNLSNASLNVPGAGLEPARPQWSQDFKSCVSTNSTTRATFNKLNTI